MRMTFLAAVAGLCLTSFAVAAKEPVAYTPQAFAAAQSTGKPILVDIYASWCPICAKQKPTLTRLESTPEFADLAVFEVDFDSQEDVVRQFGAQMQSTLIVFHGSAEKGRSIGETDPIAIKALLSKAKGG